MIDLVQMRRKVNALEERRRQALAVKRREEEALKNTNDNLESANSASQIFQSIAQTIQQQIHQRISTIVTKCLESVFDDPYEFKIQFEKKRGKTEAKMVFMRDGLELDDPLNEISGGVIDIASLGLRLACILLTRPYLGRVLVLDEPYKNVRGDVYKARTRNMLLRLANELNLQIIINTDIKEYTLGKIIELG